MRGEAFSWTMGPDRIVRAIDARGRELYSKRDDRTGHGLHVLEFSELTSLANRSRNAAAFIEAVDRE